MDRVFWEVKAGRRKGRKAVTSYLFDECEGENSCVLETSRASFSLDCAYGELTSFWTKIRVNFSLETYLRRALWA